MKKSLLALAVSTAFGLTSTVASAETMLDFHVDETSVTPSVVIGANTYGDPDLLADEINGAYVEKFTVTGLTGPSSGTFATSAYFQATSYSKNDGVTVINNKANNDGVYNVGLGVTYGMYALFTATGNWSQSGSNIDFTATGGEIRLYIDKSNDNSISFAAGATGLSAPTVTDVSGDDYLIATATLNYGVGGVDTASIDNGSFDIIFNDFLLTSPDGESYFISPRPFHLILDVSGQFVDAPGLDAEATTELAGTADAHFAVPEPGTIALLGMGLLGMGLGLRRKSA